VHILASANVPFILTTVQVPNLASNHTKRKTVYFFNTFMDKLMLIQSLLEERESLTISLDVSVSRIQDLERKQREHEGIIR
jgi:hypothetical protein